MSRYLANFEPQAWQNDYAIPVDPEGETNWDCTCFVQNNPEYFDDKFREELNDSGFFVDGDDRLISSSTFDCFHCFPGEKHDLATDS